MSPKTKWTTACFLPAHLPRMDPGDTSIYHQIKEIEPYNRYLIELACSACIGEFESWSLLFVCLWVCFVLFVFVFFFLVYDLKRTRPIFLQHGPHATSKQNHVHVCLVEQRLPIRRIRSDGNPCGVGSLTSSFRACTSLCDAPQLGIAHVVIFWSNAHILVLKRRRLEQKSRNTDLRIKSIQSSRSEQEFTSFAPKIISKQYAPLVPLFQNNTSCKTSHENKFDLQKNELEEETYLHMNGFARRLALTQRQRQLGHGPVER